MSTCFSKFNRTTFMTAFAACMAVMTLGAAPPAFAASVLDQSVFELGPGKQCDETGLTNILEDDVTCGSSQGTGPDWSAMFQQQSDGTVTTVNNFSGTAVFIKDGVSGGTFPDATTFTSQGGDTNNELVTQWTWSSTSVPSKDDVSNAYAYIVTPTTGPLAGHKLLYVGGEREAPNGDSHIDFEFFQDSVALNPNVSPKSFSGVNITPGAVFNGQTFDHGDLLVSMDFTKGGDLAGLEVRERTANNTKGNTSNYTLKANLPGQGCIKTDGTATTGADAVVCAFSNGNTIGGSTTWPWDSFDNTATIIHQLGKNAFSEFGIDLTALGLGHPCFPTIMVKTRSSQSFTAQLKDFAIRGFETCNALVSTEIRNAADVNITGRLDILPGTEIHDRAIIHGSTAGGTPTGKVTFYRWDVTTCSGTIADTQSGVDLIPGGNDSDGNPTAVADSTVLTTQPGQKLSYFASYEAASGSVYKSVPLPDTVPTKDCEPLGVTTLKSTVETDIKNGSSSGESLLNTAVDTSGGAVNAVDVATVRANIPVGLTSPPPLGDANCPAGSHPATGIKGSVTFSRYTTADCTGTAVTENTCLGATTFSSGVPLGNGGTAEASANSSADPLTGSGFLCFQATYNGNGFYDPTLLPSDKEPLCAFPHVTHVVK